MKGYRICFVFALLLTVISSGMLLVNPIIMSQIVDNVIVGQEINGVIVRQSDMLIPYVLLMVGFTLLRTGVSYGMIILYEKASQGTIYSIRNYLYRNMQFQDSNFYDRNRTGDLMTRLTGDLDMVRHTIAWIVRMLLDSSVMFIATTVYFLTKDVIFTLVLLVITPFIFIITQMFSKRVGPLYVDLRERLSQLNSNAQENIAGNRVVKAFAREDYEIARFAEKSRNFQEANIRSSMMWLNFYPAIEGLAQSLSVITLVVGGIFVINGRLTIGDLTAFSSLTWTLSNPMRMLGSLLNDLQRFFASAAKIIELYYHRSSIVNRHDAVSKDARFEGKVEFKNVNLTFGKTTVLKNLNFTVEPGETVAIMGSTGSGKTLMVSLIPRLYDITEGQILVDDVPVNRWELKCLRKNIGIATQDVFLFSDTVDGNIAYGDSSLSEEDVKKYANLAAADFVYRMEDGFDTIVGERGVGLSGGQKQRIALARALAIRPAILILDDTTSAVDLETEKYIQHSLNSLDYRSTKFITAQRISTTQNADKIIILQDGKIVEMGTHDELLQKQGYYYEIYCLQNEGVKITSV